MNSAPGPAGRGDYFLCCASGPPTPLSILVSDSLLCSVKGVVHSVVRALQFLGKFLHGIVSISQNNNRLTSFRRKVFVSVHFEPVIEPTNYSLGLANTTCHLNTGVMVADNGPLDKY